MVSLAMAINILSTCWNLIMANIVFDAVNLNPTVIWEKVSGLIKIKIKKRYATNNLHLHFETIGEKGCQTIIPGDYS